MKDGFSELNITKQFVRALDEMGITQPSEIQEKAIRPAMAGQDVLGIAQTGSGKTLAFLLPLVMKLKFAQGAVPRALILAPSKELVVQINNQLSALIAFTDLRNVSIYGGVGKKAQVEKVEEGCDILVSTPGRFLDLYSFGHIHTRQLKTLVLDEADRMMQMGFMPQLRRILEVIPVKRQNLLFSATFPKHVEIMAEEFLEFPTRVESDTIEKPVEELRQYWYPAKNFRSKLNLVEHLLKDDSLSRVIIFCRTKDAAERVSRYLERKKLGTIGVLHANKAQNTRINAMESFKEGNIRVLVTTDVTSRGIDVQGVSHVINFELPKVPEDYLHRIGRTARMHQVGEAISFVGEHERYLLQKIESFIDSEIDSVHWPENVPEGDYLPGEQKKIAIELDNQKRERNPNYQGAFHKRGKRKKRKP
jgi:ATP-dependent RNA helicase RhlE